MKPHPLVVVVVSSLSGAACQGESPPRVVAASLGFASAEPGPTLTELGTVGSEVAVVPGPTLAPLVVPGPTLAPLAPVVWPEGMEGGPGEVPVLWPRGLEVSAATWSKGVGWYTASLALDGHHVVVHGSRLRVGGVGVEAERGPVVTRMDGIVECDLVRFGVAYTVAVECARPMDDLRCVGDDHVLGLVASLRVEVGP